MLRNIIQIDPEACTGCGLCVTACHEGAIELIDGKAVLVREDHCDGLGDCLPACPAGAIRFTLREAPAYNEAAVQARRQATADRPPLSAPSQESQLTNWPVQLRLAPVSSPAFADADLLIAADCTAYAYGSFHRDFLTGRVALIGCPKLDDADYAQKLTALLLHNAIRSVTVLRMTVPCCAGLSRAVHTALAQSGKQLPCRVVTLSPDGTIVNDLQEQ